MKLINLRPKAKKTMGDQWVSESIENLGVYKPTDEEKRAYAKAKERLYEYMLKKQNNTFNNNIDTTDTTESNEHEKD